VKRFIYLSEMLFILFAFSACEKVIEFDLNNSPQVLVIEATMSYNSSPFRVLVSKTTPYFGTTKRNPVSGARVGVNSDHDKIKYFVEVSPGQYELQKVVALPGYWYTMTVEYNGITYTARSFMNKTVPIADVSFTYFNGYGLFDSGYKVNTYISDPVNIDNYYRIKYYVNGKANIEPGGTSVYSDKFFNGKDIGLSQRATVFKETDTLIIELQSIDKAAYDYFSALESISGTGIQQSTAPANPISNFSNGALGYFSAYTSDIKKVIIKDFIGN